ncbi:hypothetical protein MYU51_006903 [Penicillium brevicompactum]|uniref:uncharacterized protein n=1 Tax=Penicillium brevicompactum TaxID=5074 RepID=UPI002540761E|nr:uncharacterized protein N7506_001981 [Penicillium brevicompactum]KAJ5348728.1 hypothetical protein N7506_001981 [Penicillium brevicompactum]
MEPSLPFPSACLSHWHRGTRSFPHLNANYNAKVPTTTKHAIIGSGISGALTAFSLIENGTNPTDILILEAREAVSGASGRNAGHIRPDAFRGFPHYASLHGPEQAIKILQNEKRVLEQTRAFITTHDINSDFVDTTTFDVCMTPESIAEQESALAAYKDAGGDVSQVRIWEGEEARFRTRVRSALRAYEWPAASNNPAKLVQWILSDVVGKGAGLWTHCPVDEVVRVRGRGGGGWEVHTSRGTVVAETVVHCTNAYAGLLVPGLGGMLRPRRSQAQTFVPGGFVGGEALGKTMALRYGGGHFFSVNPLKDGMVVIGGTGTRDGGDVGTEEWKAEASFDDRGFNTVLAENSRREFEGIWEVERHGEGFDYAWTGILGITRDSVPVVGAVDGLEGQWVCAGFNGHGMAIAFTCALGLAKLVSGERWEETGLPECFKARVNSE